MFEAHIKERILALSFLKLGSKHQQLSDRNIRRVIAKGCYKKAIVIRKSMKKKDKNESHLCFKTINMPIAKKLFQLKTLNCHYRRIHIVVNHRNSFILAYSDEAHKK